MYTYTYIILYVRWQALHNPHVTVANQNANANTRHVQSRFKIVGSLHFARLQHNQGTCPVMTAEPTGNTSYTKRLPQTLTWTNEHTQIKKKVHKHPTHTHKDTVSPIDTRRHPPTRPPAGPCRTQGIMPARQRTHTEGTPKVRFRILSEQNMSIGDSRIDNLFKDSLFCEKIIFHLASVHSLLGASSCPLSNKHGSEEEDFGRLPLTRRLLHVLSFIVAKKENKVLGWSSPRGQPLPPLVHPPAARAPPCTPPAAAPASAPSELKRDGNWTHSIQVIVPK